MKLKTLKDIEKLCNSKGEKFVLSCLKAEAVKWLKSIKEYALAGDGDVKHYAGQIAFIKKFFNLTEEDLI